MPKNPYLIENKKPVEEVREIPTYQPKYTDEEVAKLKEIFIAEQKEAIKKYQIKTSPLSPEARNKVIRKWGSDYVSEDREGYGPCYRGCGYANADCTHYFGYLGKDYVPLHLCCQGEGSVGGTPYLWVHAEPCGGHMYISEDADLRCMKSGCGESGYITEWSFKCWRHKGEKPYYPTNGTNCISAMSTVLQMFKDKPESIKRVVGKILREISKREGY